MTGRDRRGLGRPLLLALGVAVLLGLAAAGGSLIRGTSTSATAGQAFPYAVIGGAAALVLGAIVFVAIRAARPGSLRLGLAELLAIGFVLAALGSLIGAALTPDTPRAEDVSPLDEDEIDRRTEQTDVFGEGTRAGPVDRDGDGQPDRDENGQLIVGYDVDGDGRLDGYLQPCPTGTSDPTPRPGYTPIDNDCDGTVDEWLPFDIDQVLASDTDFQPGPVDTISPEQRQERADEQGADGQRGNTIRNVLLILLVVAVCAAIVAWLVRMPDRDHHSDPDEPDDEPPGPAPPDLTRSLEASLDAVQDDPDPRQAICAAYGRLLDGLAEVGLPRRPEEAPEEHIRRCLTSAHIDPVPVRQLLDLFALARFSSHPVDESHRRAAEQAMRAALASTTAAGATNQIPALAGWAPPSAPTSST